MVPTIETDIGEDYVGIGERRRLNPVSSTNPNQSFYEGQHSVEEVVASWDPNDTSVHLQRDCVGGTKETWKDLIQKPTSWDRGAYLLPSEMLGLK